MAWEMDSAVLTGGHYLRILREHDGGNAQVPVYESELCEKTPAKWKQVKLSIDSLCKSDESRSITVEVNKAQRGRERVVLGSVTTTLSELKKERTAFQMELHKGEAVIGLVRLVDFAVVEESSFLDYVYGGCEISLLIGIDFTKSNGNPSEKTSLHFLEGSTPNEYVQAITQVGDILQYYDSDKRIPVFGFGAKLPPSFGHTSHCFALSGDIFDPEVKGIERVVDVYKVTCRDVTFHGPTMFSPLIHTAAAYALAQPSTQDNQHYYILLILTDGIINDMDATLDEIVKASDLPMSIIIVGVGSENFEMMKVLDADEKALYSKISKKYMTRDIVQFVPFREARNNELELARQVLFEIPKQLLGYMASQGIRPKLPRNKTAHDAASLSHMNSYPSSRRLHLPPIYEHAQGSAFDSFKKAFLEEMAQKGYSRDTLNELIGAGLCCADAEYVAELISSKATHPSAAKPLLKSALRKEKRREKRTGSGKVVRMATEDEQSLCRICRKQLINTVLVECGHRVVCQDCVLTLEDKECPACRRPFIRWVATYDV